MPTIGTLSLYMDQGKQGLNGRRLAGASEGCRRRDHARSSSSRRRPGPGNSAGALGLRSGLRRLRIAQQVADLARLRPGRRRAAVDQALGVDPREARSLDPDAGPAEAAAGQVYWTVVAPSSSASTSRLAAGALMLELDQGRRRRRGRSSGRSPSGVAQLPAAPARAWQAPRASGPRRRKRARRRRGCRPARAPPSANDPADAT